VILLLGWLLINAGYGFEGSFQRLADYRFVSSTLAGPDNESRGTGRGGNRFRETILASLPVPFPRNYVLGIDLQRREFEVRRWSYLGGAWRLGGWWYYYLYALAVKMPLGVWILVTVALGRKVLTPDARLPRRDELALLVPAVAVFVFVSSQTGINHHLRYVLPAFPFLYVWTCTGAVAGGRARGPLATVVAAALAWSVAGSLYVYPHSLAYFNESVGGPRSGHAHLIDSNIDWGQDLLYLKRWLQTHPEAKPLGLAYVLAHIDPRVAGIEYTPPPPGLTSTASLPPRTAELLGPRPGWFAVSVGELRSHTRQYAYFLRFHPVATAGYSIYIYRITPEEANRVRKELGMPEVAPRQRDGIGNLGPRV
jgi:hypothetical protein